MFGMHSSASASPSTYDPITYVDILNVLIEKNNPSDE
jgi:hypothetical protein